MTVKGTLSTGWGAHAGGADGGRCPSVSLSPESGMRNQRQNSAWGRAGTFHVSCVFGTVREAMSLTFLISFSGLSHFFLRAKLILGNFQVIFFTKIPLHFSKLN